MKWLLDAKDMKELGDKHEQIGFKRAEKRLEEILFGARNFYRSSTDVPYGCSGWTPPEKVSLGDPWKRLIDILDQKIWEIDGD